MCPCRISNSENTRANAMPKRNDFLKNATSCLRSRCHAEIPTTKNPDRM